MGKVNKKLVIGYFGYLSNKLDGQTVKTRSFYELLREIDVKAVFFDTECVRESKLNLFSLLWSVLKSDTIYYFPAHNSLRIFFPILYWISKIFDKKLYYFMIGGWLTEFLKKNESILVKLKQIDRIFCETYTIKAELFHEFNFSNLDYFPNFRERVGCPPFSTIDQNHVKLVYMGRINEGKGILDLFDLDRLLISNGINNYSIDLYGPIQEEFKDVFYDKMTNATHVEYHRVLQPQEIWAVLINYDIMIFPTHFYTEGFPGTILDAYLAGIPVVASDWKHAKEYVEHEISGMIYEFGNIEECFKIVEYLLANTKLIIDMKHNAYLKSEHYSKEFAFSLLKKYALT